MDTDDARRLLRGPVPSIRTPFAHDGSVDFDALRRIIDFCINAQAKTIMLTAGDSHYLCLSDEEIAQITRIACDHTAGRAMVIAADRHHSTSRAVEFAQYCRSVGADMYMAMPPDWAASCTAATLAEHYATIAETIPVMIVTNVFIPRGVEFGIETIALATQRSPKVMAVKDDMCGTFAHRLCMEFKDTLAIVAGGLKENHMNMWPYGCDGYLSTFMTFKPRVAHRYWQAIEDNRIDRAREIIRKTDGPFFRHIMSYPGGFDSAIHGVLEIFDLAGRWRRKPYYTLNDDEMCGLADFLHTLLDKELGEDAARYHVKSP